MSVHSTQGTSSNSANTGDAVDKQINKFINNFGGVCKNPHTLTVKKTAASTTTPDLSSIISAYQNSNKKNGVNDKSMKRILANRRSAKASRERRKHLEAELQASVAKLSSDHANLLRENQELHKRMREMIQAQNKECNVGGLSTPSNSQEGLTKQHHGVKEDIKANSSMSPVESSSNQANAVRPHSQMLIQGLPPAYSVEWNVLLLSGSIQRSLIAASAPQQELQPGMHSLSHNSKFYAALVQEVPSKLGKPNSTASQDLAHFCS